MKCIIKIACLIAVMTCLLVTGCATLFIAKYDSTGEQLWVRQFGAGTHFENAYDVAADGRGFAWGGDGNVYVTGYTNGTFPGQTSAGDDDAFIAKYNSAGEQLWVRQFGTDKIDVAQGVTIDGRGNAYVTGHTNGTYPGQISAGDWDAFLVKYSSSGRQLWLRQFGTDNNDDAYGVAVDSRGNTYVTGTTEVTSPGQMSAGDDDAFLVKYSSSGRQLWVRQFGTDDHDFTHGVAIHHYGNTNMRRNTAGTFPRQTSTGGYENVYVTGYTKGTFSGQISTGGQDAFLVNYDSSGRQLWVRQFGTDNDDDAKAVAVDSRGNAYVTGTTEVTSPGQMSAGDDDAFLVKYSSSGRQLWLRQDGTEDAESAEGVAVDRDGNAYVVGSSDSYN
ncbi:SBBP repeat-containing protein [Chloroflexota bacterium]